MTRSESLTPWHRHSQQWTWVGSPLRPCREDVQQLEGFALRALGASTGGARPRVLMLGLTPEIQGLTWPEAAELFAIDHTWAMITTMTALGSRPGLRVVNGDWLSLPFRGRRFDLVIGDGCHNLVGSRDAYHTFHANLKASLLPGGHAVFRIFLRPEGNEPLPRILEDLHAGRIGSFHAFKWRMVHALHRDTGVRLSDVWDCWKSLELDPTELARSRGWDEREVRTIDAYQDRPARYWFPTREQLDEILSGAFRLIAESRGSYEMSSLCPVLLLKPEAP